jgi:acid phosphatase (class A)
MKRLYILILGGAAAVSLFAQRAPRKPMFVSPEQLDVASVLAGPPAEGSRMAKADLAELHRLQDSRSAAQVASAKADDVEEDIFVFKDVIGPKFTREALPLTAALSQHVHNDESVIVNPAKQFFHRTRPYQLDTSIHPVCKVSSRANDYAYPSGHSTTGYLEALVVTLIVPEKREAIMARADEYAHNRLVCGVHYPSDVVASKYVAYAAIGLMLNNPKFKQELDQAKAETRRVLGL